MLLTPKDEFLLSLLAACLGIAILAIYLWKTILAAKHQIYRVNLHRISEAIKRCMKKNSELVEEISRCTQKDDIKTLEKMNEILDDVIQDIHTELQSKRDQCQELELAPVEEGQKDESEYVGFNVGSATSKLYDHNQGTEFLWS
ncbi:transport and Golgi organization protein 1 homolog isoform X2 [Vicugna pacos]|uniref:Transport and Golgi organization protein 1 homolog isoform X2 n=1 Tax=Vicugna pacos TaxID=30538 RepID=A0ABM5DLC9_VICPA